MSQIWDTLCLEASAFLSCRQNGNPLVSSEVRREVGKAIFDLQRGEVLGMPLSRMMPALAAGAAELRIRDRAGIFRVFYYTPSAKGILIFHAFVKKSQTTPTHQMGLAKKRLKELLDEEI